MSIRLWYPPIVLAKIERWVAEAKEGGRSHPEAKAHFLERFNIGMSYFTQVLSQTQRGIPQQPSNRVLKNLGFELYIKDLETGEMEKVDLGCPEEVDHSRPTSPRFIND
jgi:hypothetical protein